VKEPTTRSKEREGSVHIAVTVPSSPLPSDITGPPILHAPICHIDSLAKKDESSGKEDDEDTEAPEEDDTPVASVNDPAKKTVFLSFANALMEPDRNSRGTVIKGGAASGGHCPALLASTPIATKPFEYPLASEAVGVCVPARSMCE
jgi:hypothetical protein